DIVGAPRPLDLAAMSWAWQYGRKFAKIEVSDPAGAAGTWKDETFFVHLGSTGCYGNPGADEIGCSVSNRVALRFARFNPATQKIALDVRALLAGNDVTVNRADAPGCMSEGADPECDGVMRTGLALDWKAGGSGTGQPVGNGLGQTVFRVRPR
ncbi:MAG: metallo-mystery pair system four-Cys motif protein, partial [Thermoleophilia bacterium]|nr:metallo-mystery pair system four-Cys motif protein [Thermoleophilia bacterium]